MEIPHGPNTRKEKACWGNMQHKTGCALGAAERGAEELGSRDHLFHLISYHPLDPGELFRLQGRRKAVHLEVIELVVTESTVLQQTPVSSEGLRAAISTHFHRDGTIWH